MTKQKQQQKKNNDRYYVNRAIENSTTRIEAGTVVSLDDLASFAPESVGNWILSGVLALVEGETNDA